VVRIDLDKDLAGWRPDKGMLDKYGNEIEDRIYNQKDFDKTLVLEKRTQLVAKKISEFLQADQPLRQDHRLLRKHRPCRAHAPGTGQRKRRSGSAEHANTSCASPATTKKARPSWITSSSRKSRYPVIATTSKLMTTGVDAQTCKLIVLDQRIQSMTEFKQIIGRGTRINEDYDKYYFTIIDFKKATELFADPDFDGDPVQIYEPKTLDDSPCRRMFPEESEGEVAHLSGAKGSWTGVAEPGRKKIAPCAAMWSPMSKSKSSPSGCSISMPTAS
jgi:type I restriction enzyme, R subunit